MAFGLGPAHMYPMPRNYAFYVQPNHAAEFGGDGRTGLILVAPKMLEATKDRAEGVLRHEFGHAMDLQANKVPQLLPKFAQDHACWQPGKERRADALAESLWGTPIYYDSLLVQCLSHGITPRPTFLGE